MAVIHTEDITEGVLEGGDIDGMFGGEAHTIKGGIGEGGRATYRYRKV